MVFKTTTEVAVPDAICTRCQGPVFKAQKVCECGHPAPWMSFAERNEYEATRWRQYKQEQAEAEAQAS